MKRLLVAGGLIGACLLLGAEAGAQGSGTARGKVVDEKGQPIEGAEVVLDFQGGVTRKFTVKSNKKGEFTQVGLPPGPYRVTATKDGYQGTYTDARIALGQPTFLGDFKMTSAAGRPAGAGTAADVEKLNAELRQMVTDAEALAAAGKYDEAIAGFQALLAKGVAAPAEIHFRIGQLHSEKKDWAASETAYLKALELKPDFARAQLELANVYQISGQKEKAAELMAKAQAGGEGDASVQYSAGVVHINAGRHEEAAAAFKKAIALDPSLAEAYFHLGTIALNQNNTPEAIAQLEKYLSLNPTNAQNTATAQALIKALKK
jgi:cytochrome c-type biogenesis protein CcmH/NrfG